MPGMYRLSPVPLLRLWLSLGCVVLLAACSSSAAESSPPGPSSAAAPSDSGAETAATPSLVLASSAPGTSTNPGAAVRYEGTLSFDAIEGGCASLKTAAGQRYEVIYPAGWQLDRSRAQLIAPDGSVRAGAGDVVAILGTAATDFASICQIGPIIRAVEVLDR